MSRLLIFSILLAVLSGCNSAPPQITPPPNRESLIPPEQVKILPETDVYPP